MNQRVTVCSPEETKAILEALGDDPSKAKALLQGRFRLTCREANGNVAWEVARENLITDYGRRRFYLDNLGNASAFLFTSPSSEAPLIARAAVLDDGASSSSQFSTIVNPTYDSLTLTKSWFFSFATPASTRRIGTVGLTAYSSASLVGPQRLLAYALVSPVKTQTTSQTLELRYTIALTPVY